MTTDVSTVPDGVPERGVRASLEAVWDHAARWLGTQLDQRGAARLAVAWFGGLLVWGLFAFSFAVAATGLAWAFWLLAGR